MKKTIVILVATAALLAGCGADKKEINGVTYGTYGFVNQKEMRNPDIQYEMSPWSVLWSIVFVQTIIAPIYFIGWDLYEPVGVRDPNWVPGQVSPATPAPAAPAEPG